MKKKSPFEFGFTVTGKEFTNRVKEQKHLQSNFENRISTILISPRRWGKSSLIEEVTNKTQKKNKNVRIAILDLFTAKSEEEFYQLYATKIIQSTSNKLEEWLESAKIFFKNINPSINLGIDPVNDFSVQFSYKDISQNIEEILNLPEEIAKKKSIQIVVCIDEFQNISNFDYSIEFQKKLRAIWQRHKHVCYCLYGSKRHMMLDFFQNQSMPFYRFGETIFLDKIDAEDWKKFIVRSFKNSEKTISSQHAKKIAEAVKHHSYYVQQLSHICWVKTKYEVSEETIEEAINDIIIQNAIFYQKIYEDLSFTQVNFLKALANGEKKFSSQRVLSEYKLGVASNVVKIKEALEQKEVIDTFLPDIEFLDPVFELWFRKTVL